MLEDFDERDPTGLSGWFAKPVPYRGDLDDPELGPIIRRVEESLSKWQRGEPITDGPLAGLEFSREDTEDDDADANEEELAAAEKKEKTTGESAGTAGKQGSAESSSGKASVIKLTTANFDSTILTKVYTGVWFVKLYVMPAAWNAAGDVLTLLVVRISAMHRGAVTARSWLLCGKM